MNVDKNARLTPIRSGAVIVPPMTVGQCSNQIAPKPEWDSDQGLIPKVLIIDP